MQILSIKEIPYYARLGQNIYRHDGLLVLPRGIVLSEKEMEQLDYFGMDYVFIYDKNVGIDENSATFLLGIIVEAIQQSLLISERLKTGMINFVTNQIIKNKKIQEMLLELRRVDTYSLAHSINISLIIVSILEKRGLDTKWIEKISLYVMLHDVGRLKMMDVFGKKGKLTDMEFQRIKEHPLESYEMLKKAGLPKSDIEFVIETHEKNNGTGYPYELRGNEISVLGQLVLLADVYNALSSFRPYRKSVFSPYEVVEMMEEERGRGFSNEVFDMFKEHFIPYKKETQVVLNTGKYAKVKDTRYSKLLPIVEVINELSVVEEVLDLRFKKEIWIKKIIKR